MKKTCYKVVNRIDGRLFSSNSYFEHQFNVEYEIGKPAFGLKFGTNGEISSRLFLFCDLDAAKLFYFQNNSKKSLEIWECEVDSDDLREDISPIYAVPARFADYWDFVNNAEIGLLEGTAWEWMDACVTGAFSCSTLTLTKKVLL